MRWWTLQKLKSKDAATRRQVIDAMGESAEVTNVQPLIQSMADSDSTVRAAAATALGRLQSETALPSLIHALRDRDGAVREAAAQALRHIPGDDAIDPLIAALKDPHHGVRYQSATTLDQRGWQPASDVQSAFRAVALGRIESVAALGTAALEALALALKDSPTYKRKEALDALSRIGDARVIKPIVAALRDPEPAVRTAAVEALDAMGSSEVVEPLVLALRDREHLVRAAAATALGRIGDARSVQPLAEIIRDDSWDARLAAVEALGRIGTETVFEPLIAALNDRDHDVRLAAVQALGNLRNTRGIQPLVSPLKDENTTIRQAAAVALRKIDPQWTRSEAARLAVPELKTALNDKEYWVRQAAADILARINAVEAAQPDLNTFSSTAQLKRQEALEVLRSVLQDPDRDLRQAAAEALGRIGDHRVSESLAAALADEDVWVRRASAASLTHLHWEPQTPHAHARWLVESLRWEDVPSLGAAAIPPLLDNLKQIQEPTGDDAPLLAALRELTEAHAGDFGPDELQSLAELAFTVPWASDAESSDPATATLRNDLIRVQELALEELARRA